MKPPPRRVSSDGHSSPRQPPNAGQRRKKGQTPRVAPAKLRIIAGEFRGRRIEYSGDQQTRPMKDRLRETVFNRLGAAAVGAHALDLFAGTGALGLEALSRGARDATFIENFLPAAKTLKKNIASLGLQERCTVVVGDAFSWVPRAFRPEAVAPWLVFSSPPYAFYSQRREEMLSLLGWLIGHAPAGSAFVVEADAGFDFSLLPRPEEWDVRSYRPAVVGILHIE